KVCIRQRIGGSNPPLTAIFKKELVRKYGLFFHIKPPYRGGENTRPGFDNWRSQLDRRRACEETARRASAASQSPPHRHIQERARTKVRAFVSKLLVFTVIFLMKGLFLDLWLLHQTYYRLCKTAPLPYLKRFRKVCISISR
ncbi:hypothetical protein K801_17415, partial [Salmonella enterica subsp. enterica serovar Newport str. SHSN011]